MPQSVLHQSQSTQRRLFSRAFHALVQLLFRLNIQDTQCGAKVMRREAAERIHSSLRIADVAFDINLLYALKRNGFTQEGVLRQAAYRDGKYWDIIIFGILKDEIEEQRRKDRYLLPPEGAEGDVIDSS